MSYRETIIERLQLDLGTFRAKATDYFEQGWLAEERFHRTGRPTALAEVVGGPDVETLTPTQRDIVWRMWLLADAPVGLTLAGPTYEDTPSIYANGTTREPTGYSLPELRGENPRLLQGPETAQAAVASFRAAIDIWEPVTVELRNHRRNGAPFRNRVSLVPSLGASGTSTNRIGVQEAVGPDARDV